MISPRQNVLVQGKVVPGKYPSVGRIEEGNLQDELFF